MTALVQYTDEAAEATRALPAHLQRALERALRLLLSDPTIEPSEPLAPGSRSRIVRASQSVTLTYEPSGEGLHITDVTAAPPTGPAAADEAGPATITTGPEPLRTSDPLPPET